MDLNTVEGKVIGLIAELFGLKREEVTRERKFIGEGDASLNADSLDSIELIMEIEDLFSTDDQRLSIPDEDAEKIGKYPVGVLIDYVYANVNGRPYQFPE